MSGGPDLDGWPVLRIDQIPTIDSELLSRAGKEALDLSKSMLEDCKDLSSQPKLVFYLNRQIEAIKKELAQRAASERVAALLLGAEEAMSTVISPLIAEMYQHDTSTPPDCQEATTHSFKPVPLPSELKLTTEPMTLAPLRAAPLPTAPSLKSTNINDLELREIRQISSPGEGELSTTRSAGAAPTSHEVSAVLRGSPKKPRPSSGTARKGAENPTQKSVVAMYQSFGNTFVVGAVEKRLRFFPKKTPVETDEELRARDRLDR